MKKSNVEMIKEIYGYWIKEMNEGKIERGFASKENIEKIKSTCEIEEKDFLELRNLRDTAVLYFRPPIHESRENKDYEKYKIVNDCMSAITHVLDSELSKRSFPDNLDFEYDEAGDLIKKKIRKLLLENFDHENFPFICHEISLSMAEEMKKLKAFEDWSIIVERGHYNHPDYDKDLLCEEDIGDLEDYKKNIKNGKYLCEGCTCNKMQQHTYIKAYLDEAVMIYDFTNYQFNIDKMSDIQLKINELKRKKSVVNEEVKKQIVEELMSFNNFMTSNYNSYYPGISNTIKGATK
jgi:FtsZ-binding cell division protein ZapB